jgi:acyl carrier protein
VTIFETISKLVAENAGIPAGRISADTSLSELGIDSLEFMEMMLQIQAEFRIEITDEEIARMNTVGDMCRAVETCQV